MRNHSDKNTTRFVFLYSLALRIVLFFCKFVENQHDNITQIVLPVSKEFALANFGQFLGCEFFFSSCFAVRALRLYNIFT